MFSTCKFFSPSWWSILPIWVKGTSSVGNLIHFKHRVRRRVNYNTC